MERLRVGVALAIVTLYCAGAILDAASSGPFDWPPGTGIIAGAAVAFILGEPAIRSMRRDASRRLDPDKEKK